MKGLRRFILIGAAGLLTALQAPAATITLFEYAFNIDGAVTNGAAPGGVNMAGFDTGTGLGTISASFSGAGNHYVALYVDHEIDEAINTWFNENGSTSGATSAGQSWEIDEPGYAVAPSYVGDIYTNFGNSTLDNSNGLSTPDDVSMALAWSFALAIDETATINFVLSESAPGGGFYLTQTDPDSPASIYMSSALNIRQGGPVPEPGSLALVGLALLGAWQTRRKPARS